MTGSGQSFQSLLEGIGKYFLQGETKPEKGAYTLIRNEDLMVVEHYHKHKDGVLSEIRQILFIGKSRVSSSQLCLKSAQRDTEAETPGRSRYYQTRQSRPIDGGRNQENTVTDETGS